MSTAWNTSNDTTVRPASLNGRSGYFAVPLGWPVRYEGSQLFASPNADFSSPKYACWTNEVGVMVFMDLMRTRLLGQS